SSGLHSNGYSLARAVLEPLGYETLDDGLGNTVGAALLAPTTIYVRPVLALLEQIGVRGIANITGGGFFENIPRAMPESTVAAIQLGEWPMPPIFDAIANRATIEQRELYNTFNMGIGMVVMVSPQDAAATIEILDAQGVHANAIGRVLAGEGVPHVVLQ